MNEFNGSRFSGADGRKKCIDVLLTNELVNDNREIAEQIFDNSELINFEDRNVIIKQGKDDDDVYFIISGKVEIKIQGKTRSVTREAPIQIGEMSALNTSDPRSATVSAVEGSVKALKISAKHFNNICDSYSSFKERALIEQNNRNKAWKAAMTEMPWYIKFFNAKFLFLILAIFCHVAFGFFLRRWLLLDAIFVICLLSLTITVYAYIKFNRTRVLFSVFVFCILTTLNHYTNPYSVSGLFTSRWLMLKLETVVHSEILVALTLITITIISGIATCISHHVETKF